MEDQTPPQKRNIRSNTTISVIALAVSCIAVLISGIGFYYQHLHKWEDLKATMLTAAPEFEDTACTTNVVFANNGNLPSSITSIRLEWEGVNTTELPGIFFVQCSDSSLPFTVNERSVISKQFKLGDTKVFPTVTGNYKKGQTVTFAIVFGIVDARGLYHSIRVPVFQKVIGDTGLHLLAKFPKVIRLLPSEHVTLTLEHPRYSEPKPK